MEPSNRREALAALAAAISQSGAATLGALACQEPMLPDPATFGRLILSFHKSYSELSAQIRATNEIGKTPQNRNAGAYQRTFGCQGCRKAGGVLIREGENDKRGRFVAVLEIPPMDSAQWAVQPQIVKDVKESNK
jgi:hypothetical protein